MKILLGLLVVLLLAGGAFLWAVRSNGPAVLDGIDRVTGCLLYTSPSPRD